MNENEPVIQRTFQAKAWGLDITGSLQTNQSAMWLQQSERGTEHRGRRKTDYPGPGHAVRTMDFTLIPYFSGEIYAKCQQSIDMKGQEGKLHLPQSKQERDLDQGGGKEADS